jgi:hypothetical protein
MAMTKRWKSSLMQSFLTVRGPLFSTLVMGYRIFLRRRRRIYSSRKQAVVYVGMNAFVRLIANLKSNLVTYCKNENVPFKMFENFSEILGILKDIVAGKMGVKDIAAGGA